MGYPSVRSRGGSGLTPLELIGLRRNGDGGAGGRGGGLAHIPTLGRQACVGHPVKAIGRMPEDA